MSAVHDREAPTWEQANYNEQNKQSLDAEGFLGVLFPSLESDEMFEMRAIMKDGRSSARHSFFIDRAAAWKWAQQWMFAADVYVGVAPRCNRDGTARGVCRLHAIWGDFDFKSRHDWQSRRAQLKSLPLPPSLVVATGGGFHAYWLLDKPLEGEPNLRRAVNTMQALARCLDADVVGDLPRILRLPETFNHKYAPPRRVKVAAYWPDARYGFEEVVRMVEEMHRSDRPAAEQPFTGDRPGFDTSAALQGVPEGQRDITIFKLACKLRRAGVPIEMAGKLCVEAAQNCTPPFDPREAIRKVVHAYGKYPANDEEEAVLGAERAQQLHLLRQQERAEVRREARQTEEEVQERARPSRRRLQIVSGTDLLRGAEGRPAEPPSLSLLGRRGYIMEGWSHLIAGYPRAGKTELVVRLMNSWLSEGREILYLTEESRLMWEYRLERYRGWANLDIFDRLHVGFGLTAASEYLLDDAMSDDSSIVVVDTIRGLVPMSDETDNSRVAAALNPWIGAARERNKTLIMVHHMRKGSGENGEGIAGAHAMLGAFDVALELLRDEHRANRRRIRAYARLVSPPEVVYEMDPDTGEMRYLGEPSSLQLSDVVERVRSVVGEEWDKTRDIREALGEPLPGAEQVRLALLKLAEEGAVERDPPLAQETTRGHSMKWRRIS